MSEQYGQYGPQHQTEYEVTYPPLGRPAAAPPPAAAPATAPGEGRPGIATAAAILALVEAGLLGLGLLVTLVRIGVGESDLAGAGAVLGLLGGITLVALLIIGAVFLLRGSGRLLLLVATWVETVLIVGVALWLVVAVGGLNDALGLGAALTVTVLVVAVALLALPVVRLVLVHRPSVGEWVARARERRAQPPAPVWSPATGSWVQEQPRNPGAGAVLAVVVPAAALAVVAAVVVTQAGGPGAGPYAGGSADPYAQSFPGSDYAGNSSWGHQYYRGGDPLPPPPSDSALYDPQFDFLAQSCADGSMNECDQLYYTTPIGDFYEWFGSSCAGRLDHETSGGCALALGSYTD